MLKSVKKFGTLDYNVYLCSNNLKFKIMENISVLNKEIILSEYSKLKRWKKSPKNYNVFDDNPFVVIHREQQNHGYNNFVGNLSELFNKLTGK